MVDKIILCVLMFLEARVVAWGIELVMQGVRENSWSKALGGFLLGLSAVLLLCDIMSLLLKKQKSAQSEGSTESEDSADTAE